MTPYVYGPPGYAKFMWNLDSSVGKGGANNNATDISFVQWYYTLSRDFHLTTPAAKAIYKNVAITGKCTGQDSDPLVQAILSQQRETRHPTVDGKISVAKGTGKVGDSAYFILRMGARMAVMYPQAWPRLDQIPHCPGAVAAASKAAIPQMAELGG
ncbi:MAG: hypothetical protein K5872_15760 [Rhizobiaceae bacterium]|nr:hypothetical protein [Rhizobiaceae bacterium]MCV0407679.1 hypothetical protein [Rhizobiaceae bacterium]